MFNQPLRDRMLTLVCIFFAFTGHLSAQSQRPVVVLIHGRDQGKRREADVKKEFVDALFLGLQRARLENIVQADDVKFVWYGDIYADDGVDRTCPYVQTVPPAERSARQSLSDAVRRFLVSAVSNVPGLEHSLSDILIHDTEEYLSRANFRCATDKRLTQILDAARTRQQPVIIAAHSMGSLVTFSVLRRFDVEGEVGVAQVVTMGSQLGMNEVLRALDGSHASIPVKVPISIQHWTNLVAKGDLLALRQSGFFDASNPQRKPVDTEVDNGNQSPHSAVLYIRQSITARTIARAFCDASTGSGKPAGCNALR
jgi:hypothetical protein